MHYITGTSFSVKTHNNFWDKQFHLNNTYYLANIFIKKKHSIIYTFKSTAQHTVEIEFESCKVADSFIAKHRKEVLPNYDNAYESRQD